MPDVKDQHSCPFKGFTSPTFTLVPDELFDELLPRLSGAELKVLLYITRRTFGFKKDSDNISLSQMLNGIATRDGRVMDHGVGLTKKTLLQALRSLEEQGIIVTERRSSEEKGNEPTCYKLRFVEAGHGVKITPPLGEKLHQGGGGEITPRARGKNYPTQQTVKQQTDIQDHHHQTSSSPRPPTEHAVEQDPPVDDDVFQELIDFGVSAGVARRLVHEYPTELVLQKLDFTHWLVDQRSPLVARNPAGFLRKAVEDDYPAPRGYSTAKKRVEETAARNQLLDEQRRRRAEAETSFTQDRAEQQEAIKRRYPPQPISGTPLTTTIAWQTAKDELKKHLSPANFGAWLATTQLITCDADRATIACHSSYQAQTLARRFDREITTALRTIIGQAINCEYHTYDSLRQQNGYTRHLSEDTAPHPQRGHGQTQSHPN